MAHLPGLSFSGYKASSPQKQYQHLGASPYGGGGQIKSSRNYHPRTVGHRHYKLGSGGGSPRRIAGSDLRRLGGGGGGGAGGENKHFWSGAQYHNRHKHRGGGNSYLRGSKGLSAAVGVVGGGSSVYEAKSPRRGAKNQYGLSPRRHRNGKGYHRHHGPGGGGSGSGKRSLVPKLALDGSWAKKTSYLQEDQSGSGKSRHQQGSLTSRVHRKPRGIGHLASPGRQPLSARSIGHVHGGGLNMGAGGENGNSAYHASKPKYKKRYVGIGANHAYVSVNKHSFSSHYDNGSANREPKPPPSGVAGSAAEVVEEPVGDALSSLPLSIAAKGRGDEGHVQKDSSRHVKPTGIPGVERFDVPIADAAGDNTARLKKKSEGLGPSLAPKLYIGGQNKFSYESKKQHDENVPSQFVPHPPSKGPRAPSLKAPSPHNSDDASGKTTNTDPDTIGTKTSLDDVDVMTPSQAFKKHMNDLSDHEHGEILEYPKIYFVGAPEQKIRKHKGANRGYDDERGDYKIVMHDHIAYRYEVMSTLGKGSFGQVVKCYDYKTGGMVALKIIRNKKRFHQQAKVEVNILKHLKRHDPERGSNIIHLKDHFYFRGHLCITFSLMSVNLYEFIKNNNFRGVSLGLIRRFAVQLLASLQFLRKQRIIHCDLKPENILLKKPNRSGLSVIDLGSSCFVDERVYTYIQSRFYRSPEVILGLPYGTPIDMWSFACILAELYTGYPLFPGENEQQQLLCIMEIMGTPPSSMLSKASRRKLFFDSRNNPRMIADSRGRKRMPGAKDLSRALKCKDESFVDFIQCCLRWDPDKRFTPEQAMSHPWVLDGPAPENGGGRQRRGRGGGGRRGNSHKSSHHHHSSQQYGAGKKSLLPLIGGGRRRY